jgi:Protein of unknown function (DUF1488)/ATP dependent DNA ligase domain
MPLRRLNDEAFAEEVEGVSFGMMTDKGTTVQCFVSHAALTDKARTSGQGGMQAFHKYRSEVEDIASAKYGLGNIEIDGRVTVSSHDLNPEQFP